MANDDNNSYALPLKGYRLMDNTMDPNVVGLALETEQGPFMFVVTKEILEVLSRAFAQKASEMPAPPQT
jgi:hypothetical protein